jgi:hypothetical protein
MDKTPSELDEDTIIDELGLLVLLVEFEFRCRNWAKVSV